MLTQIKSIVEIVGIAIAVIGAWFAFDEFRQSTEQRRIENQIALVNEFSPSVSYLTFDVTTSPTGLPSIDVRLKNETDMPLNFLLLGANYFDCTGANTSATPLEGDEMDLQEYVFLPQSILRITADTDPFGHNVPPSFVSDEEPEPFVLEWNFSASLKNIDQFSNPVSDWGVETYTRRGAVGIREERALTWIYSFRAAYIFDGRSFRPYGFQDCFLPDRRIFDVELN